MAAGLPRMQGLAEIAHPQTAGLPQVKGTKGKSAKPAAKSKRPAKKKR